MGGRFPAFSVHFQLDIRSSENAAVLQLWYDQPQPESIILDVLTSQFE